MSGAGKSVVLNALEDVGYFCVDNMPPTLLEDLVELSVKKRDLENLAIVMDSRLSDFEGILLALKNLRKNSKFKIKVIYLDASDNVLVKRFKETRRSHPLSKSSSPNEGIQIERYLLEPLKALADVIVDSSYTTARELKNQIMNRFKIEKEDIFRITMLSFGFKYGVPTDVDLMFDVRFLPNPFYDPNLRPLTGEDSEVYEYVVNNEDTIEFLKHVENLLGYLIPKYINEGRSQFVIGIGCTGGQHRSVSIARYLGKHLKNKYATNVWNRDIERSKI